jgi:hypothetical protein
MPDGKNKCGDLKVTSTRARHRDAEWHNLVKHLRRARHAVPLRSHFAVSGNSFRTFLSRNYP